MEKRNEYLSADILSHISAMVCFNYILHTTPSFWKSTVHVYFPQVIFAVCIYRDGCPPKEDKAPHPGFLVICMKIPLLGSVLTPWSIHVLCCPAPAASIKK